MLVLEKVSLVVFHSFDRFVNDLTRDRAALP